MKRFGMLKELMRAVDLVTLAEREPVMNKMLIILRREALGLDTPIAASDLASLSSAMTELEHEAGRVAPTPSVFNRHVAVAIGALRRTAMHAAFPRPVGTVRMRRNCGGGNTEAPPVSDKRPRASVIGIVGSVEECRLVSAARS
jgi:hypothetical protein